MQDWLRVDKHSGDCVTGRVFVHPRRWKICPISSELIAFPGRLSRRSRYRKRVSERSDCSLRPPLLNDRLLKQFADGDIV